MDTSRDAAALPESESESALPSLGVSAPRQSFFSRPISRRGALGAAALGVAGVAAAALDLPVAEAAPTVDLTQYFSILATGEALFTTFYALAIQNHVQLGLFGADLDAIKAIAAEEEIHYQAAVAQGGTPAMTTFSFPHGAATFTDRNLFLQTQQLAEELTNGALNAWILDMANAGQTRLAQLGGQLQQVEGGHRVVGRVIMTHNSFPGIFGTGPGNPYDDWAFGPVPLTSFTQVPTAVTNAGFLSPVPGNSFPFTQVSTSFPGLINTTPGTL